MAPAEEVGGGHSKCNDPSGPYHQGRPVSRKQTGIFPEADYEVESVQRNQSQREGRNGTAHL